MMAVREARTGAFAGYLLAICVAWESISVNASIVVNPVLSWVWKALAP